jgi:flagellar basal-body rod protein FlgB
MRIFDPTLQTLERALDARLDRHTVLAGNLANADTPGYQPRDVNVAAAMAAPPPAPPAVDGAPPAPGHLPLEGFLPAAPLGANPEESAALASPSPTLDGNAVDVDRTMVALAENALQYGAAARAAAKKLAILRYVASDGAA